MTEEQSYKASILRAEEKRARLIDNAQAFKARISPARLKADAKMRVRDTLHDTKGRAKSAVRRHPVAVGVIGTGLLAWLFRRPIARLISRFGPSQAERSPLPPVDPAPSPPTAQAPLAADPPLPADNLPAPAAPPLPENDDEK